MKYDPSNPSSAEESIFEPAGGKRLKIKSSVTFHLYVRFVRHCAGSDRCQQHCRTPGPGSFLRVSANLGSVCFLAQHLVETGHSLINPAAIRRVWWGKPSISLSLRTPNKASCGPRWRTVSVFTPCTVGWLQSAPLSLSGAPEFPYPSLCGAVVGFEAFRNKRGWVKGMGALKGVPSSSALCLLDCHASKSTAEVCCKAFMSLTSLSSTISFCFSHVKNDSSVISTEFPLSCDTKMFPEPGDRLTPEVTPCLCIEDNFLCSC